MSRNRIEQHPDEFRADLNPDYRAGQNDGSQNEQLRTAYDIKELHQQNSDLRDDELKQIPVLEEGTRLEQGATYYDLRHPERGIFTAMAGMAAAPDNWYVPKTRIGYDLWNLITGESQPERMGDLVDQEELRRIADTS
jgi:hypothetical protein